MNNRLSENEQAFAECFSRFVNGQMGSAAKVGNALADDHRYLINEKGKVVFAFLERLANDYQKGRYDQRDEWVCRLAAETIDRKSIKCKNEALAMKHRGFSAFGKL